MILLGFCFRGSFEEIDSWFGKHNRHLALWFAILMFFSIFIWGVAVNTKNDTEMFAGNVANDKREFLQGFGTCQNTSEEIVCQNFNNFTDLINKINEKVLLLTPTNLIKIFVNFSKARYLFVYFESILEIQFGNSAHKTFLVPIFVYFCLKLKF